MRGTNDFAIHNPLLTPLDGFETKLWTHTDKLSQDAHAAWSAFCGNQPVVLARSVHAARHALLQALAPAPEETILLPANVSHALREVIQSARVQICFGALDANLELTHSLPVEIAWAEPAHGLASGIHAHAQTRIFDHGDSLPRGAIQFEDTCDNADVLIFGLQLCSDVENAGALLVFRNEQLAARTAALLDRNEPANDTRALLQLEHLREILHAQMAALQTVHQGLQQAAGLVTSEPFSSKALPRGVAVRIPDECNAAQFMTYARGENTPVMWLAENAPLHYTAAAHAGKSAQHLERWLLVPVAPHYDHTMLAQAVLGIVKTAEYLGVRWRTNPARAFEYAQLLNEMYGAAHDAYRPAFPFEIVPHNDAALNMQDLCVPLCQLKTPGAPIQSPLVTLG